ncbi:hypothetical protein T03_10377, partial [Trichinella britovi]
LTANVTPDTLRPLNSGTVDGRRHVVRRLSTASPSFLLDLVASIYYDVRFFFTQDQDQRFTGNAYVSINNNKAQR